MSSNPDMAIAEYTTGRNSFPLLLFSAKSEFLDSHKPLLQALLIHMAHSSLFSFPLNPSSLTHAMSCRLQAHACSSTAHLLTA
jgi:hypothetical protein